MAELGKKENLINTLLQLIPDAYELKWDRATLWEHQANEKLIQLCPEEALALYQQAISEKKLLLRQFEKNREQWDNKRYYLAQTYLTHAKICTNLDHYNEAKNSLTLIFELLSNDDFSPCYQRRVLTLLIDGHRTMIDILSSLASTQTFDLSK